MQTITLDILHKNVYKLLQDLELLKLIKLRKDKKQPDNVATDWAANYKGAMSKQSISEVDNQLNELRNEWE